MSFTQMKKIASYHGCAKNIYDYGEDVICVVKNKGHGKDHTNINNLSLNLDDNISKRKQIATYFYTNNDNKKIKLKQLIGSTLMNISEQKAREAIKG